MEITPGQEQESRSMNNEEIQPGIVMETASPLDHLDRKKGLHIVIKKHTHIWSIFHAHNCVSMTSVHNIYSVINLN